MVNRGQTTVAHGEIREGDAAVRRNRKQLRLRLPISHIDIQTTVSGSNNIHIVGDCNHISRNVHLSCNAKLNRRGTAQIVCRIHRITQGANRRVTSSQCLVTIDIDGKRIALRGIDVFIRANIAVDILRARNPALVHIVNGRARAHRVIPAILRGTIGWNRDGLGRSAIVGESTTVQKRIRRATAKTA